MGFLYKGNKRINKVRVKTKVDSSFITATAADIMSGKKSIDSSYNTITGSMTQTTTLASLTSDANATAADVTKDKTIYVNGSKITGTAVRPGPSSVVSGIIESYKVANYNNISAGDFVKFVDEVCGCGYNTRKVSSAIQRINTINVSSLATRAISPTRVLMVYSYFTTTYLPYACIININGSTITVSNLTTLSTDSSYSFGTIDGIYPVSNNRYIIMDGSKALMFSVSATNAIARVGNVASFGTNMRNTSVTKLSDNRLLVVYTDNSDKRCMRIITVSSTTLTISGDLDTAGDYVRTAIVVQVSTNRLIVVYNSLLNTYSSSARVVDISNLSSFVFSTFYTVSVQSTTRMKMIKQSENKALLVYRHDDSSTTVAVAALLTVSGMGLSITGHIALAPYGKRTDVLSLDNISDNVVGVAYCGNSEPVSVVAVKVSGTNITRSAIYDIPGNYSPYVNLSASCYETNKLSVAFHSSYPTNECVNIIVEYNPDTDVFNNSISVPDYSSPLTQTMVALSTGSDSISGIANTSGMGRLYGGDTINIVRPNV